MIYYIVQLNKQSEMDGVLMSIQKTHPFLQFITRFDDTKLLVFKYSNEIDRHVDTSINNMSGVRSTAIDDADVFNNGYSIYGF